MSRTAVLVVVGSCGVVLAALPGPYSLSVRTFSAVGVAVWLLMLWWAFQRRKDPNQWHHFWILLVGTLFWWLGESLAIRLGKYAYAAFPFAIALPFSGTPENPDGLARVLHAFFPPAITNPPAGCRAGNWAIPFPVIALEAALVFAMLRLAHLRLIHQGFKSAVATAGLNGVLLVSLTAVLDPVVSTSNWCGNSEDLYLGTAGLNFGLWTWFTNGVHQGFWFGVPLVNYVAWFVAAFVFSLLVRLDNDGPGGIVKKHRSVLGYLLSAVLFIVVLFLVTIPLKHGIDTILVHGQKRLFGRELVGQDVWQFTVIGGMLVVLGLIPLLFARTRRYPKSDPLVLIPQFGTLFLCLFALFWQFNGLILLVWFVSLSVALVAMLWPWVKEPDDKPAVAPPVRV
jgi:hypothetical protein